MIFSTFSAHRHLSELRKDQLTFICKSTAFTVISQCDVNTGFKQTQYGTMTILSRLFRVGDKFKICVNLLATRGGQYLTALHVLILSKMKGIL